MSKAVWIIRDEHRRYGAVLNLVRNLLGHADAAGASLDADLVERALDYVEEFIDTFHHPKEDEYLFPAVLRRSPDAAALVETLERQHADGPRMLGAVREALAAWRDDRTEATFASLREAAVAYIDFEGRHAMSENDELLPIAERALTGEDWSAIDAAFERNDDPAFGAEPRAKFEAMVAELARRAPAPWGHGAPR